ncbi:hypothetical protein AB0L22_29200 [Micromonospora haikouensis]|uniref:hypothetical protein n=1 Tax=Micromonospora haikouensis TaxID=686309 RepID=UPI0034169FF6
MRRVDGGEPNAGRGDEPDGGERGLAGRGWVMMPSESRTVANRVVAYLVFLCWHGLVIVAYLAVLDRQSSLRGPSYGNSPWEDMVILGVYSAPVFLGTLVAGLFWLWSLLAGDRIRSAVALGTVATSPTFLLVAMATLVHLW